MRNIELTYGHQWKIADNYLKIHVIFLSQIWRSTKTVTWLTFAYKVRRWKTTNSTTYTNRKRIHIDIIITKNKRLPFAVERLRDFRTKVPFYVLTLTHNTLTTDWKHVNESSTTQLCRTAECGPVRLRTQIRRIFLDPRTESESLVTFCGGGLTRILFLDEFIIFW